MGCNLSRKGPVRDDYQEWTGEEPAERVGGAATLAKGSAVLSLIASNHKPLRFADLQRRSELPKATLHRLLVTLRDEGLIRCHDGDRTYRLGMRLFEMAHHVWETFGGERPLWVNMRPTAAPSGWSAPVGEAEETVKSCSHRSKVGSRGWSGRTGDVARTSLPSQQPTLRLAVKRERSCYSRPSIPLLNSRHD